MIFEITNILNGNSLYKIQEAQIEVMKHPIDYIFIDTSLFISSPFFKENGVIERLFDQAEKGYVKILMPAITEREWFKHFEENTKVKFDEIEKRTRLMGKKRAQEFLEKHSSLSKNMMT